MTSLVRHRILTTELGFLMAALRLTKVGYTKFDMLKSGHPSFPIAIELDAPEDEEFDFLRPDILPPKKG